MGSIGIPAVICIICVIFYSVGFLQFLTDFEDKCEMTYMFEYPQFVRISQNIDDKYPKYGLYAYSEGKLTSKARNMYFDGIPVLFIPGNAGSHKQVRSLSSVALRKMLESGVPYHFDYFTIDLNNELSGLYGPLLYDQFDYANHTISTILQLYKDRKNQPQSVVLIGHSMGGIIAMKLLSHTSNPNLIPIIINLSSPLKRAVTITDYHLDTFYNSVYDKLPNSSTIVSVSGGYSDFLIPPFLSQTPSSAYLYTISANIPKCWVQSNHVQIVWCKQLVLALNRALFDCVDVKMKQISSNATYRQQVFQHHLFHHSGINVRNKQNYLQEVKLDHHGAWKESILKLYSIKHLQGVGVNHWYMVKLDTLPGYEILSILAINLETTDWIYLCNAYAVRGPNRICVEGKHLTHLSEIAPSVKYKRRYFETNLHQLRKNYTDYYTHVVFRTQATNEPVIFHVDVRGADERRINSELPHWWSFTRKILIEKTDENALRYDIVLPGLKHVVQTYQLLVEPVTCNDEFLYHVSASLLVPWNQEASHFFFTNTEKKPAKLRLHTSKPTADAGNAVLRLTLEPSCAFRVSIKSSISDNLGQIARIYTPLLLTNVAVIVLMSLRHQLICLEKNGRCSLMFVALRDSVKPFYVLTGVMLLFRVFGTPMRTYFPSDIFYMIDEGTDSIFLPLLLFISSIGFMFLLAAIFGISLVVLESSVHKLALKFLARTVSFNMVWSDYIISALHKIPFAVSIILIFLSMSTCGGLAICLGGIFYFLKLTQMSKDFVEEVVWYFVKKFGKKLRIYMKRFFKKSSVSTSDNSLAITSDNQTTPSEDGSRAVKEKTEDTTGKNVEEDDLSNVTKPVNEKTDAIEEDVEEVKDSEPSCSKSVVSGDGDKDKRSKCIRTEPKTQRKTKDSQPSGDIPDNQTETDEKINNDENVEFSSTYNSIFFHGILFLIWFIIAVINLPAVLTWARNFKFNKVLSPDDSFISGLSLSLCTIPLWQFEFPRTDRQWFGHLQIFVFLVAIVSLLFAIISVYRLNYLLTLTVLVITCQQTFAPLLISGSTNTIEADGDIRDKYENVKRKME